MSNKGFYELHLKRPMDIILSLAAIIVLAPVFLLITILVRKNFGKPVIFTQERPGLNEKIFKMYKFRSMTDARDANGELLPDEVRLTKFGKFLRSTSLDELPELINILKGDMSIVGPRPLAVSYLPYYNEKEKKRHSVLPGLSGLAQINGRNSIEWDEKFKYDIEYCESVNFWKDLYIVFATIKKVLLREGIGQGCEAPIDFNIYRIKQNQMLEKNNE